MPEEMIRIPGLELEMGTPDLILDQISEAQHYGRDWFEDETPLKKVQLDPFLIDRTPVTNEEYAKFVAESKHVTEAETRGFGLVYLSDYWAEVAGASWKNPGGTGTSVDDRPDHPVVHIGLSDAQAYAAWSGKRLPTESEWELAARGPSFRVWPWGNEWNPEFANTAEYRSGGSISNLADWKVWWAEHIAQSEGPLLPATTPVGFFSGNGDSPFGVSDMAGNVMEWTGSRYEMYDTGKQYDEIYKFVAGKYFVMRGGGWMNFRYQTRCAERMAGDPNGYSNFSTGFRCVRDC